MPADNRDQDREIVLRCIIRRLPVPWPPLDEVWPVHHTAVWPESLSLRRDDLYEETVCEPIRP